MRWLLALVTLCYGCQKAAWNGDAPWATTPVTVEWTQVNPDFDGSLSQALAAWNYAAGCQVLARAHDATTANVSVQGYDGTACGREQLLPSNANAGTVRCTAELAEVRLKVASDIRSVFVIVEHELGHVLGLAHDRSALMMASPDLDAEVRPLPSDADGAAVGARYCR